MPPNSLTAHHCQTNGQFLLLIQSACCTVAATQQGTRGDGDHHLQCAATSFSSVSCLQSPRMPHSLYPPSSSLRLSIAVFQLPLISPPHPPPRPPSLPPSILSLQPLVLTISLSLPRLLSPCWFTTTVGTHCADERDYEMLTEDGDWQTQNPPAACLGHPRAIW